MGGVEGRGRSENFVGKHKVAEPTGVGPPGAPILGQWGMWNMQNIGRGSREVYPLVRGMPQS